VVWYVPVSILIPATTTIVSMNVISNIHGGINKKRFYEEIELPDGDKVLWEGSGDKIRGRTAFRGRLYVTTKYLIWTPVALFKSYGPEVEKISLSEIKDAKKTPPNGLLDAMFAGGAQYRLKIVKEDGTTDLWVVDDVDEVGRKIMEIKYGETPGQEPTQNKERLW
jgi:hypothetical protein